MKLVIATPLYPPEIGGPATYAKLLESGLPQRGITVDLVKFSDVRHLPKLIRHYVYYRRVCKAVRRADAVLALDPVSVGLPALWAAQKARKPFVVKIVGDYAWEQGQHRFGVVQNLDEFVRIEQKNFFVRKLQKIQKYVAQNATKIIVPSEYLKGIVKTWGIKEDKIIVFNNAIKIPEHLSIPPRNNDRFLVVSAGRRVPWKGFEAIERIVDKHPKWDKCIVSGLPREEALGWIQAADVFVLNSSYEGFAHVLVEAMTLGTPVVVTRAGGNTELVTHGETGLLVPVGDDTALEAALVNVANDSAAARERAIAAQKRMGDFSLQHMLDVTAGFLTSL
jgi:glycosyltransferase involved in cell wall biosynthesis